MTDILTLKAGDHVKVGRAKWEIAASADLPAIELQAIEQPKADTRLIKIECPNCRDDKGHAYCARITRKWLDRIGAPWCPGCEQVMVESQKGDK